MKIVGVKINNFRCFDELTLSPQKCHALIGENGTGKTAVLEAINLATSPGGASSKICEQDFNNADTKEELLIEVYFDAPFILKVPDGYVTRDIPCNGVRLSAHRRNRAAPGRALSQQFVVTQSAVPLPYEAANPPVLNLRSGVTADIPAYVRKTESGYTTTRKNGSELELSERILSLQNDTAGYPNIFYFPKDREKESKTGFSTLLRKIATDLNWRYRTKWNQAEIARKWEEFYREVIDTVEDAKGGRIIEPVRNRMRDFVGRNFDGLELSFLDLEQPFSKSFFSQRTGTNVLEQTNLGSGISILLSFFLLETVSLLSKEEIIILIDEPELHLHPQLQQRFLSAFNEAEHQVIYTTQSDCFVDIAEWQSISRFCNDYSVKPEQAVLDANLGTQKIREHLDEIKKWHQQKTIFFREDNQLFFAKKVILVEGPAEKYGLPVISKIMGLDLDDATILSCNGKAKVPYYQLLCKSFGIPYYTLIDLDGKAEADAENKAIIDSAATGAISKLSTSFEALLGIGATAEHKASKTLTRIDELDTAAIPEEIATVTTGISTWSLNQ